MPADLEELLVLLFFSAWLVVTAICQFPSFRLSRLIRRFDACALIPRWTFFAPNPAVRDLNLLFRDAAPEGVTSPWNVFIYRPPPTAIRWLWNPTKRSAKFIHDLATLWLLAASGDRPEQTYMLTVPYLALLHQVARVPRSSLSDPICPLTRTQIAIGTVFSREQSKDVEILVVSPLHRL